jgi:hypothetical protein
MANFLDFDVNVGRAVWKERGATWNLGTELAFDKGPMRTMEDLVR